MKLRTVLLLFSALAVVAFLAWGAIRIVRATTATAALELPTTRVKHGRVTLTVACRGELQGGNSEMLAAPMIAGGDMAITSLRDPGELVSRRLQLPELVIEPMRQVPGAAHVQAA